MAIDQAITSAVRRCLAEEIDPSMDGAGLGNQVSVKSALLDMPVHGTRENASYLIQL
jgi:hypothetical protein